MRLDVCNLKFGYEKTDILKDISFTAKSGELVFLLGPNGTGKTTLFRCILGILKKYSGCISIDGKSISKFTARELAGKMAYIPQSYDPTFSYSVLDIVLMGEVHNISAFSSPDDKAQTRALDILERLGIRELAIKCFAKLSGGEQQLVMVARALMQSAGILLMDEPTSSLDYGNQLRLLQKIKELSNENYLILLSSHNPQHALSYADRILAMYSGEIIADGRPEVVLDKSLFARLYGTEVDFVDTDKGKLIAPIKPTQTGFVWNHDMIRYMKDASEYGDYYHKLAGILAEYIPEAASVCDAGCGLGYLSLELVKYSGHVTAIDISDDALNILRQNIRKNIENIEAQSEDTKSKSIENGNLQCEKKNLDIEGDENNTENNKLTIIQADMEKLTAEDIKHKTGNNNRFDCMIFNFFGDTLTSLRIAKRLCREGGRVLLVKKDWYKHRFSLTEKSIKHHTLDETFSELQKLGIKAELNRQELEMGQPFRSVEDAVEFYKTYNCDDKSEQPMEEAAPEGLTKTEQSMKEAVLGRLVKTDNSEYPYYLPQKKAIGIFVIEADDIPDDL